MFNNCFLFTDHASQAPGPGIYAITTPCLDGCGWTWVWLSVMEPSTCEHRDECAWVCLVCSFPSPFLFLSAANTLSGLVILVSSGIHPSWSLLYLLLKVCQYWSITEVWMYSVKLAVCDCMCVWVSEWAWVSVLCLCVCVGCMCVLVCVSCRACVCECIMVCTCVCVCTSTYTWRLRF